MERPSPSGTTLREFLAVLEREQELLHIYRPVDPRRNLGAWVWRAENEQGKASYLHNLVGFPGWTAVSYVEASRKRLALAMGTTVSGFIPRMRELLQQGPTPTRPAREAPCQEVVQTGEAVDLTALPIHVHYEEDAGPYLCGGIGITRNPETGVLNATLHRHQLFDRNHLGILMHPNRHTHLNYQAYEAENRPMPIALAVGVHPILYLCTCWTFPRDVYELDMAGTFLGQPVETVPCLTVPLEVPADAELVIEGHVLPHERRQEGPFTEHTGYARAGAGRNPVIEVTAITRRRDAIYYALQGGKPIASSQILDALPQEIGIWERVKDVGGFVAVKDVVSLPYAGGSHVVVVQFTPQIEGQAKDVLLAALSSPFVHPKIAIAVDDDVNPHDPKELFWSLSTRVDPARDVVIIEGTRGHHLDASLPLLTPEGEFPHIRRGAKMLIDATKPPTRNRDARSWFTRSIPKGWDEVDFSQAAPPTA
jgi:2,5-furandicarboxylate decarboxylase 1